MSEICQTINKFIVDFLQENSKKSIPEWEKLKNEFSKVLESSIVNVIETSVEKGISSAFKSNKDSFNSSNEKKSRKKKGDNGSPKKPLNGFFIFCINERTSFKEENTELNPKEITSKLAELWKEHKESNSETYQKYTDLAKKDKERFDKEKEEYINGGLEKNDTVIPTVSVSDSEIVEEKKQKTKKINKKNDSVSDTEIIEEKKEKTKKKKTSKKPKEEIELDDE